MKYQGTVEFVKSHKLSDGTVEHEITFGPRIFDVNADSAADARDKLCFRAKSEWRAPKGQAECIEVRDVRPLQRAARKWLAFQSEFDGEAIARRRSAYGSFDYVSGQLYGFWSKRERDEWAPAASGPGDFRRVIRAGSLPKGWTADDALDPATNGLMEFRPRLRAS